MKSKSFYGLLAVGLLVTAATRFATFYTGHFSLVGLLIGLTLGGIITACLWWSTRGEAKKGQDARRDWRIVMAVCLFGFLIALPIMFGFGFR